MTSPPSAFPYPGGKTYHAKHIVPLLPKHRRYVEPFAGSASVLLNKPESYIEVINDVDRDVVQFFRTARDHHDELVEWLRYVPFSRDVHLRWTREFFDGHRPDDAIERAGRWFSLRYTSYGAKLGGSSGFKTSGLRSEPRSFRGAIDSLENVVDRLAEVTIECQDYQQVIERYDDAETIFYCDPPYLGTEHYYNDDGFDHDTLAGVLADVDGRWICSHGELPAAFDREEWPVRSFDAYYSLDNDDVDGRKHAKERLVCNFEPDTSTRFAPAGQTTFARLTDDEQHGLTAYTDGGEQT